MGQMILDNLTHRCHGACAGGLEVRAEDFTLGLLQLRGNAKRIKKFVVFNGLSIGAVMQLLVAL